MGFKWSKTVGEVLSISREQADHALDVVPPVYGVGCFAMGEPQNHQGPEGAPRFHWIKQIGWAYFTTLGTRAEAEEAFARLTPEWARVLALTAYAAKEGV